MPSVRLLAGLISLVSCDPAACSGATSCSAPAKDNVMLQVAKDASKVKKTDGDVEEAKANASKEEWWFFDREEPTAVANARGLNGGPPPRPHPHPGDRTVVSRERNSRCSGETPVPCGDGTCARLAVHCQLLVHPVHCTGQTPHVCPGGLTCASHLSECPCTGENPFKCSDGSCRPRLGDCEVAHACPSWEPVLCQDGSCRATSWDCPENLGFMDPCPASLPVMCTNGDCVATRDHCPENRDLVQGCPSNEPIMCPDGTCKMRPQDCPSSPHGFVAGVVNPYAR